MQIQSIDDLKQALIPFNYVMDSGAEFLGTGSEQVVIKTKDKVVHFIGLGYSQLKPGELQIAVQEMRHYFSHLNRAKISTSKPDFDGVVILEKPFPLIIIADTYEGESVPNAMDKSEEKYMEIFEKLLTETLKAVKSHVPMDSSAKNYVLTQEGRVVYVDFFIPYTSGWLFHENKSEEYALFTLLNFFVPNCELFIFVSKSIIKRPHLRNKIMDIVYQSIEGDLLNRIKEKLDSKEFDFLLDNYHNLIDGYKENLSHEEIFNLIGYYDKTQKLLLRDSQILDSSYSIRELYKEMSDEFIARPYNCLLWSKKDIDDALDIMEKIQV